MTLPQLTLHCRKRRDRLPFLPEENPYPSNP